VILQIARVQRNRGRGDLAPDGIAELVVHAQVADQLGGEQIRVQPLKRSARVRLASNAKEDGQEFADRACIDVAVEIAWVGRSRIIGIDSPDVAQSVLLA